VLGKIVGGVIVVEDGLQTTYLSIFVVEYFTKVLIDESPNVISG
jgi:hypothetical protein